MTSWIHEILKILNFEIFENFEFWKFWNFVSWFMIHEFLIFYLILDYVVFLSFSPLEDRRIKVTDSVQSWLL